MGHRKTTRDLTIFDQKVSRVCNGKVKIKERARRHNRLVSALKAGQRTPTVISWLSHEVGLTGKQLADESMIEEYLKTV
ncbi:MAG: hypothetical protein WCO91_01935 [Gemmataceae bacterium]|nr:hypothetical protein [Planctomycetota bacterium]